MSHVPSYSSLKVHSGQAYKTLAGSLGETRENKGCLSTTVFTFSIHGQAEGCSAFLFSLRYKTVLKNTPFSIIIFYVMKGLSFLSYAAITFLSLTFNSCHCTLLFHSLAQVHPITAWQASTVWGSGAGQLRHITFTSRGRWHRKIWDTEGSIDLEHLIGSDIHTGNMR